MQSRANSNTGLSLWDLTAIGINSVIGSGIFLLPGLLMQQSGPACLLAFIGAGLLCIMVSFCFAEAGGLFIHSGGSYIYAREAFGKPVGFLVGWMSWLGSVATWSAVAVALTHYLGYFFPAAESGLNQKLIIIALMTGLAVINYFGVRQGAFIINLFTVGKLLPLLIFVGAGLCFIQKANFAPFLPHGWSPVWLSIYTVLFAYAGFEVIPIPSEEVQNPKRNVPLAILIVISFVTAFYILIQTVAIGTLPGLASSQKPLAEAAANFMGHWGGTLIAIGAIISIAGINASTCLVGPRCLYAMAEDRLLPAPLASLHPRFHTPVWGLALNTLVALALALSGSFEKIVLISVIGKLAMFLPTCLAVPVLRRKMPAAPRRFKVPGGMVIPVLSSAILIAVFIAAPNEEKIYGAIALVVGGIIYALIGRKS